MPPNEAAAPEGSYELLDPEKITPKNTRNAQPSAHLISSIRQFGVLQPVRVLRTPEGELHLRVGDRRRKACIELGIPVPAIVLTATVNTTEDEIKRIFEQWAENQERENFTAAERAGAVATLFDLGVPDRRIAGATGLSKPEIAAARKAAASETALALAAQYPLTMDQLAVITEFDDDQETATQLAKAAQDNPGQFPHLAERARNDRADAAMVAARAAELTAAGIALTDGKITYKNELMYWAGPDRQQLTVETHRDCPGHVVHLYAWGNNPRQVLETGYCADPGGNGHKKYRASADDGKSAEEASAERRRIREGNDAWRAATTARQRWLKDVLLQRQDVPGDAAQFIVLAIAAAENHVVNALMGAGGGKHKTARELLGGLEKDTYDYKTQVTTSPLVDSLTGISEQRAHMNTLALIVGAYEDQAADTDTWRRPSRASREYLSALTGWGYTLSPIEEGVVGVAGGNRNEQAAEAAGQENGNA